MLRPSVCTALIFSTMTAARFLFLLPVLACCVLLCAGCEFATIPSERSIQIPRDDRRTRLLSFVVRGRFSDFDSVKVKASCNGGSNITLVTPEFGLRVVTPFTQVSDDNVAIKVITVEVNTSHDKFQDPETRNVKIFLDFLDFNDQCPQPMFDIDVIDSEDVTTTVPTPTEVTSTSASTISVSVSGSGSGLTDTSMPPSVESILDLDPKGQVVLVVVFSALVAITLVSLVINCVCLCDRCHRKGKSYECQSQC